MSNKPPRLRFVGRGEDPSAPPSGLGNAGRRFWKTILKEYVIDDAGTLQTLWQICASVDRLAECGEVIKRDGLLTRGARGPREHPLLKTELAIRAFVVRALARLGLDAEPPKSIGRPPAKGYTGDDDEDWGGR
jgi:hypothetical protein